ncbi:unnamed protein product [Strongylus vulgaris]|uniref:P-type ATPase C-terminal domain-containing protein n=1 Tax=Strongylus vulgaris TaxID=40348 RepID=A0A3P7L337_STRVU|nr:unnamed protein product [Strongylus vulgaris]
MTAGTFSGPTFAIITHEYPELLDPLVTVCDVFARMAPDQKQQLINCLQEVGYTVAMCGDGANDCAALKVTVRVIADFCTHDLSLRRPMRVSRFLTLKHLSQRRLLQRLSFY